ncbi:MAG: DUF1501 domain-containing protein [Myxococcota bacterium]
MKKTPFVRMNRRHFLAGSGAVGLSATGLTLSGMRAASAQASKLEGYKALVCVLLAGGADSFNMLVPSDAAYYDRYASFRSDLALARETLVPLEYDDAGRQFGLHPALGTLGSLFDDGKLAFVSNVGLMVEPTTEAAITSGSLRLPLGLFSHSDQIEQWQTSLPDARVGTGVAGRMADLLAAPSTSSADISMNISLGGANTWQTGQRVVEYAISGDGEGVQPVFGYDETPVIANPVDTMLAQSYASLFRREYAGRLRGAVDAGIAFSAALRSAPTIATEFAGDPFSRSMQMIARTIGARESLGAARQTFFVVYGGWDHHDNLLSSQAQMLPALNAGLSAFELAMEELDLASSVTTFTISDFGRTLTSNGRGSDHGWGGHQIVMGGAVNGGEIFGAYPELIQGEALDVGRGNYAPTLSTDEFYAEIAQWFGVANTDLSTVLPNVGRFYDPTSGAPPIGFLEPG